MRAALVVAVIILAGALGWLLHDKFRGPDIDATALRVADQINRISKYATAEGLYSRMYRYRDEGATSWLPFRDKQIMVRADARVLVGFSFDSVQVEVDRQHQALIVRGWPQPQELAFEFDTEYFDIQEGLFTSIDSRELNAVRMAMRERLQKEVDYPKLYAESYAQADELLAILRDELAVHGWSLSIEGWPDDADITLH